jgi:hypothetical protein
MKDAPCTVAKMQNPRVAIETFDPRDPTDADA